MRVKARRVASLGHDQASRGVGRRENQRVEHRLGPVRLPLVSLEQELVLGQTRERGATFRRRAWPLAASVRRRASPASGQAARARRGSPCDTTQVVRLRRFAASDRSSNQMSIRWSRYFAAASRFHALSAARFARAGDRFGGRISDRARGERADAISTSQGRDLFSGQPRISLASIADSTSESGWRRAACGRTAEVRVRAPSSPRRAGARRGDHAAALLPFAGPRLSVGADGC